MKRNLICAAVRRHALMSAGALALGAGGAMTLMSLAQAADADYAMTNLTTSGTGGTMASVSPGVLGAPASVQDNSGGALSASIVDSVLTITNTILGDSDTSESTTTNLLQAFARGNLSSTGVAAEDLVSGSSTQDFASLAGQRNLSISFEASVASSTLGNDLTTNLTGDAAIVSAVDDNTISDRQAEAVSRGERHYPPT